MGTKDNLNKAVYDMFGVGKEPTKEPVKETGSTAVVKNEAAPAAKTASTVIEKQRAASLPCTYIGPGSEFEGSLKAKGDVEVAGDFRGDIISDGKVILHAQFNGNVTAAELHLVDCKMTGDVSVTGLMELDATSAIVGNTKAKEAHCAGKVEGDMVISGFASLESTASLKGNLKVGSMNMARGALLSGNVEMGLSK